MRCLVRPTMALALLVVTAALAAAQADAPPERWQIQATGPVTVTMDAGEAVTAAWARSSDGAWHRLEALATDGRIELALGAEQIRGGSALVVINPPEWLNLEDAEPPAVIRFTIDGVDHADSRQVALGWSEAMPHTIGLAVQDEHNRIDPASARVTVGGRALRPGDPGVRFVPHGEKAGTLEVDLRQMDSRWICARWRTSRRRFVRRWT